MVTLLGAIMNTPNPAKGLPQRIVIEGRYVRLEPLAAKHVADLYRAVEPERFTYLVDAPPQSEADIAAYVEGVSTKDDPLFFAVVDKATGKTEGRQALMRMLPEHGTVELGYVY